MSARTALAGLGALLTLAACSAPADRQDGAGDAAPVADASKATGPASGSEFARAIVLTGVSCGDSCYLEYTDGGDTKTALCNAPQCGGWIDAGALPAGLKGKRATATFGRGEQRTADGTLVRSDYPAVTALTIPGYDPATAPPATASTAGGTGPLGLRKGVYTSGGDCGSIANAGMRMYDGTGLAGSATRDCRSRVLARSGPAYTIANDCVDTYTGKRSTQDFTITVKGSSRFTLSDGESGTFDYCPTDQLDPMMRKYAPE